MKTRIFTLITVVAMLTAVSVNAQTEMQGRFGIRGGLGTDYSGGLAYGVGGSYIMPVNQNYLEIGAVLFGGSYEETSDNGFNEYTENTDVFVFGAMVNMLFGYQPFASRTFFITGFGLGSVSMTWEERSPTDGSLGTPLPGGGSMQEVDGSAGASIFNLGVGQAFASGLELRAELPVLVAFSAPGEASTVVPTLIVTAGYRFK